jgi:hypothetical protein
MYGPVEVVDEPHGRLLCHCALPSVHVVTLRFTGGVQQRPWAIYLGDSLASMHGPDTSSLLTYGLPESEVLG